MPASTLVKEDAIFVGLPCYNRPAGLKNAIRCLQQQTHQNWTALISDNASPDPEIRAIAEHACENDSRLQYHCHAENIGAADNFRFVAQQANQPLFMWASDDDLLEPQRMATDLRHLAAVPDARMSFCTIDAINRNGHVIRNFDGFSRFTTTGQRMADIENFLDDPEILGKANLIYGLFKTPALHQCIEACWDDAGFLDHGGDVVFLFSYVCRNPIVAHDEVHLHKRQDTLKRSKHRRRHPRSYKVTKASEFDWYLARHRKVAPSPEIADLAERVLRRRRSDRMLYSVPLLSRFLEKQRSGARAKAA